MSDVHIRQRDGMLWLILDRPPLNIVTTQTLDELTHAMRGALQRPPRLLVVTGAGERAFSAGVDIRDHLDGREREMLRAVYDNCAAFEELRSQGIPSVALVKGYALGGGCELAALCDTVIARDDAVFGLPEITLGVFPPVAAAYFPSLIGYHATMRLILTGETVKAAEAFRLGLVHQVLPARRFLSDAEELLVMLAAQSARRPAALR
jgi:enoyl-CoA hydratase/carnithine racemase